MSIVVNNISSRQPGAVTSKSWSHTVNSQNDRLLTVMVCNRGGPSAPSTVRFNGDSLTKAKQSTAYDGCDTSIWYMVAPDSGTHSIQITWSSACGDNTTIGALDAYNVDQENPILDTDEQTANGAGYSKNLTVSSGGLIIHGYFHTGQSSNNDPTAGSTKIIQRFSNDSAGVAYEKNCTASSQNVGWTGFNPDDSAFSAGMVSFKTTVHSASISPSPSPSISPSISSSVSPSASLSPSISPSVSPSFSPSISPSISPSPSPSPSSAPGSILASSNGTSNLSGYGKLYSGGFEGWGQAFESEGGHVNSVKFFVSTVGSPTGNAQAKVYALDGTFGTDGKPTGAALATSGNLDVATIGASTEPLASSDFELKTLTFSAGNQPELTSGAKYVVTLEYSSGDADNFIAVGYDDSSPTHAGNASRYDGSSWTGVSDDLIFYYYRNEMYSASPSISPSVSSSVSPSASLSPSVSPSPSPSISSSISPSVSPSALQVNLCVDYFNVAQFQSLSPSISSSFSPSVSPSLSPSISLSLSPSISLSVSPSFSPSMSPSRISPINLRVQNKRPRLSVSNKRPRISVRAL